MIKPALYSILWFPIFIGTNYDHPSPTPISDKQTISSSFGMLVIL